MQLANNPESSHKTRHIDVRHHFSGDLIAEQVNHVAYVPSKPLPVDSYRLIGTL